MHIQYTCGAKELLFWLLLLLLRGQGTRIDDADLERSEGSLCSVVDSGEELKIRRGLSPVQLFVGGGGPAGGRVVRASKGILSLKQAHQNTPYSCSQNCHILFELRIITVFKHIFLEPWSDFFNLLARQPWLHFRWLSTVTNCRGAPDGAKAMDWSFWNLL